MQSITGKKRPAFWSFACRPLCWGTAAGASIIALCIQTPLIVMWGAEVYRGQLPDMAERGQFGDMFGAANAVFSGFAFLGLIIAIHLQRRDLQLNSAILEQSKVEMAKTNTALDEQTRQMQNSALFAAIPVMIVQEQQRLRAWDARVFGGNREMLNVIGYAGVAAFHTEQIKKAENKIREVTPAVGTSLHAKGMDEFGGPPLMGPEEAIKLLDDHIQNMSSIVSGARRLIDLTNELESLYTATRSYSPS